MYKICQVIFSTNRVEYLTKVLESQKKLDFRHCEVTRVIFDDWPEDRNDRLISMLAHAYGFDVQFFHPENRGITTTWQEMFDFVKAGNFDYIWSQEDDAEIMYPIRVIDMIEMLQDNPNLCQIQLRRDNWYAFETEPIGPKDNDTIWGNYRIEHGNPYFWMMSCLYPAWIASEPIKERFGNPSECTVANYMLEKNGSQVGLLKTAKGGIMVNHMGEYTRGIKCLPDEMGWDGFKNFDPKVTYNSRNGTVWTE